MKEKYHLYQLIIFNLFLFLIPYCQANQNIGLQVNVLREPVPVQSVDSMLLIYEVHLYNPGPTTYRLGRIDIFAENNQKLASYSGAKLRHYTVVFQKDRLISNTKVDLPAHSDAFVYVWMAFEKESDAPRKLRHDLWLINPHENKSLVKTALLNYELKVLQDKPVVLSPPLKGFNWLAFKAAGIDSEHRRDIIFSEGKYFLPSRYAVDWLQLCPKGFPVDRADITDPKKLLTEHEVLAAADGKVVQIENQLLNFYPGEPLGHYLMQEILQANKKFYVLYAHLLPSSINVKTGDFLHAGQVIGMVANNDKEIPNLHFQVSDTSDALKSEGLPFIFKESQIQSKAQLIDNEYYFWKPFGNSKIQHSNILPTADQIFYFDDKEVKC